MYKVHEGKKMENETIEQNDSEIELDRPRLDRLFEKAVMNPVTLVVAEAGYGKSRALNSFLQKKNFCTAWLHFSEYDNDPGQFWNKFTDIARVYSVEMAERLKKLGFPSSEHDTEQFHVREPLIPAERYIIVFDDFHFLQNREVLNYIQRAIVKPQPNSSSIVVSRNEPPLYLDSSSTDISRITQDDLCFTREEIAEYFNLLGLRLPSKTINSVHNDTEGWAFAVHLASLSIKNSRTGNVYMPQVVRSSIFKLIENEIFGRFSPKLQNFLIKLALVDKPTPELLNQIADSGMDGFRMANRMEKSCSLARYDPLHRIYRLHPLFFDYLQSRQDEISEKEKETIWKRTALWCSRNNRWPDAIHYFEKAGDYRALLQTLEVLPSIAPKQSASLLLDVLNRAPPGLSDEFPALRIVHALVLLALEMFEKSKEELLQLVKETEACGNDKENAAMLSTCYANLGFLDSCTCIYTHDYSYVKYFIKAVEYSRMTEIEFAPPANVMTLHSYLCRACESEEMDNFNQAYIEMSRQLIVGRNGCGSGGEELILAEAAFFKEDVSRADELLAKAITKARQNGQFEIESRALFYALRLCLYSGASGQIPKLLGDVEALSTQQWFLNRRYYHDLATGWLYVQTGQAEKIAAWLKKDFEEIDINPMLAGLEILLKAKLYFSQKRYPAALAVLEKMNASAFSIGSFLLGKLERKILEAVCRYRMDDQTAAFKSLEDAWELARHKGLWMPFSEWGKDMRTLAEAALKAAAALKNEQVKIARNDLEKMRRGAAAYAKNLRLVSGQYAPSTKAKKSVSMGTLLSTRERSVLAGLAQGLTREEIARVSSISVNTVKSAIRSIYSKTGAINRADAVRMAAEQGML